MTPVPWSDEDSVAASEEGWDLFDVNGSGYMEIECIDEDDVFASDEEALHFVRTRAAEDSPLHARAWAIHDMFQLSGSRPKL